MKGKWSCFLSWSRTTLSSDYLNESDLEAWNIKSLVFIPCTFMYIHSSISKEKRAYHCKVSFPREKPLYCIQLSTQLSVKDFFCYYCISVSTHEFLSELGSSSKAHTSILLMEADEWIFKRSSDDSQSILFIHL